MAYNDTSQEFLNSITKHNCRKKWIDEARAYQKDPSIATSEDMKRLYNHILTHILNEDRTTGTVKEAKVFEAPKEEDELDTKSQDSDVNEDKSQEEE